MWAAKGTTGPVRRESHVPVPTLPLISSVVSLSHLIPQRCCFLTYRKRGGADDSRIPLSFKAGQSTEPLQMFIHSFNKVCMSTYYVSSTMLRFLPRRAHSLLGSAERWLCWDKEGHRAHRWPRNTGIYVPVPLQKAATLCRVSSNGWQIPLLSTI